MPRPLKLGLLFAYRAVQVTICGSLVLFVVGLVIGGIIAAFFPETAIEMVRRFG